jgi:hypothetical protein
MNDVSNSQHPYESFIWPYFMEQEAGAQSVADAYKAMEAANTCQDLRDAVGKPFPFDTHFHDFALRNLDDSRTFASGSISPITPRYQALHSDFPDHVQPLAVDESLAAQPSTTPPLSEPIAIPALRAWYFDLTLGAGIEQVDIDASKLQYQGGYDVDAVVDVKGSWRVQHLSPGKSQICTPAGNTSEIWLVVSNHEDNPNAVVVGNLDITPLSLACNCPDFAKVTAFNGTANFSYSNTGSGTGGFGSETESLSHSASGLHLALPANASDSQHAAFSGTVSGGTMVVHDVDDASSGPSHTTQDANGPVDSSTSTASVEFDPAGCTYTVDVQGAIVTSYVGSGPPPPDGEVVDNAFSPKQSVPSSLQLAGSATINTYLTGPTDPTALAAGFYGFQPSDAWASELWTITGTDPQTPRGTATLSWNLTPTFAPGG